MKANPHRNAKGTVIEAGLDKSKGPVATFIVQNGTLKRGDIVVCGEAFGKVCKLEYETLGKFFKILRINSLVDLFLNAAHSLFGIHVQVRALFDDGGNRVDEAGPSIPVQVCSSSLTYLFLFLQ